jgi:tetratricopeptide (TPR) repeat protein
LNPSYAEARIYYAHLLIHLNRPDEALEQARLAENIEPVSPLIQSLHCIVLGLAGRDEDALAKCREVLERDPRQIVALDGVANSLKDLGPVDEYVATEIVRWRELGSAWLADLLEHSIEQVGFQSAMSEAADSMLARASRGEFITATDVAIYLADANRPEEALDWIELAHDQHAPAMPYLIDWSWPAEVRTDPRFSAVVERMGLPAR